MSVGELVLLRAENERLRRALAEIEAVNRSFGEHGSMTVEVKAIGALLGKNMLSPEDIHGYWQAHPIPWSR